jgi:DNA processing protein
LARGIDAAAHEAALPTGTVAVLAGGIDQIYPPQNAGLQQAIAARGLLLAEAPFGTPPVARAFPRRNRIVSGLTAGRSWWSRRGGPLGLADHRPTRR